MQVKNQEQKKQIRQLLLPKTWLTDEETQQMSTKHLTLSWCVGLKNLTDWNFHSISIIVS